MPLSAVKLLGRHLLADVLAAAAVASLAGVAPDAMTRAVEGFTGLEHALEPVAEIGGVRFVNDSKATNIESARRAIESFGTGLVVIIGGRFKGGDFGDLRDALVARGGDRWSRSAKPRRCVHEALEPARRRCTTPPTWSPRCGPRSRVGAAGQHGAARAGVRELRHVRDYAERGRVFKREVRAAGGGMERARASSEQSSVRSGR